MAIGTFTFEQEPIGSGDQVPVITNWTPVVPYSVQQTDISGLFYFKFILDVRIGSSGGLLIAKLKQRINGRSTTTNVSAVFDVKEIINSILEPQTTDYNVVVNDVYTMPIHKLGANDGSTKPFSLNASQVLAIYVKGYQEFSSSATDSPAPYDTTSDNDTRFYMAATLPLEIKRGTDNFQASTTADGDFGQFQLDDSSGKLLSDVQQGYDKTIDATAYYNKVRSTDYHTVGFLNGYDDFDSEANFFRIRYYNAAGTNLTSSDGNLYEDIDNITGNGGKTPATGTSLADRERLLYFGCGPGNLEAQTAETYARPSDSGYSGWAYYSIQANKTGGTAKSALYYFIKDDDNCKGFKVRRLGWLNNVGCWDYFNFKMKSRQTVNVKRNEYSTMLGEFNKKMYSYDNFGRGRKTRKIDATLTETINTDWLTESEANLLESLIISNDVYVIENDDTTYTVPVIIKDTRYIRKTIANDKLMRYTITIEYANPLNTNS